MSYNFYFDHLGRKQLKSGQKHQSLIFAPSKNRSWRQKTIFLSNFFKSATQTPKEKVVARKKYYKKMWLIVSFWYVYVVLRLKQKKWKFSKICQLREVIGFSRQVEITKFQLIWGVHDVYIQNIPLLQNVVPVLKNILNFIYILLYARKEDALSLKLHCVPMFAWLWQQSAAVQLSPL